MKTTIEKSGTRKIENGKKVRLPKQITMIADNQDDEEILSFIIEMNKEGGLNPSIDVLVDMITKKQLRRVGDKWQLQVGAVLSISNPELVMFG